MTFYLSSYKFGDRTPELKDLIPDNRRLGHINNARDFIGTDPQRKEKNQKEEVEFLNTLGFEAEVLDLKAYFGKTSELKETLQQLSALWVSGGNTFVLRQAMYLSGFDKLFTELLPLKDFLYGGYSAGICVLSKNLKPLDQVDDAVNFPYPGVTETIWDGLNVFPYSFMPHYDSDHFESEVIGKEIQRCIDNKWLFKALRDGDVIIDQV